MQRLLLTGALLIFSGASAFTTAQPQTDPQLATIRRYCYGCHNDRLKTAGVSFEDLTAASIGQRADVFEKAVHKLRGRQMPPPGSRQPDQQSVDALVAWLETNLDAAAAAAPRAGLVPAQRLTRTEFATSVNGLLGIELNAEQLLPAEIEVNGFDNVAAALTVSPAFLDQYVAAARVAAKLAVGDPAKVTSATYSLPPGEQPGHLDGLPLGTRGGLKFRHNFPADGEYRFTVQDVGIDLYSRVLETPHTLVILVDGREVVRRSVGGSEDLRTVDRNGAPGRAEVMKRFTNVPVQLKAGTYDVAVTFIERARVETDEFVGGPDGFLPGDEFSRGDHEPRLVGGVQVMGPFNSPGVSETPSRRKIFVCKPAGPNERACVRRIASNLARQAYRRPVTDADLDSLMPYYDKGRQRSVDAGIEQMIAAILVTPDFLYRAIRSPGPLSDLELASRLSFFLWSEGPDDILLQAAAAGKLHTPEALRAQALRMLADRRASSLVRNFAMKSFDLDKLAQVIPDPNLYPSFDDRLRRDMQTEVESFIASVLLDDRNIGDLLTSDQTFLNERLARHYGITSVFGPQFRRVTLDDPRRWGLLGKGAMLLRTSYGDRTSPVLRGAWVLGKLMGTPPTPPPPDVDVGDLSNVKGEPAKTVRARLERHRTRPGCNQCHGVIDPIGLAMENFDAIGRWRDKDAEANAPIDAHTVLPDGRAIDGPVQLRDALFSGRDLFVRAFTEKLMMYALGRELKAYDMPQVRAIVRQASEKGTTLPALVAGIVTSDAFRVQGVN